MSNYAFISYSHGDLQAVRKFHKKIESYVIPRMVRKQVKDRPRRVYPVFRDETDLAGTMLTPQIEAALADSAYLIVICTDNSARSVWVKQEIELFLQHRNAEYIIPVFFDRATQKAFEEELPEMLSALGTAMGRSVLYCRGRRKRARFEITATILGCYAPLLAEKYFDNAGIRWMIRTMLWIFLGAIILSDALSLYYDHVPHTEYCRDISFCYDLPSAGEELNVVTRLFVEDYYKFTYYPGFTRVEHITSEDTAAALPGSYLLESDCMDFYRDGYWKGQSRCSMIVFRDKNDQVLFVKNFALESGIADLTVSPDSCEPFFLPDDMTCTSLSSPEAESDCFFSCRIAQQYNEAGQIRQIWFLSDTFSYFASDLNGYYGIEYSYAEDGTLTSVAFLDEAAMEALISEDPT